MLRIPNKSLFPGPKSSWDFYQSLESPELMRHQGKADDEVEGQHSAPSNVHLADLASKRVLSAFVATSQFQLLLLRQVSAECPKVQEASLGFLFSMCRVASQNHCPQLQIAPWDGFR